MSGPALGVTGIVVMAVVLFLFRMPVGFVLAIVGFAGIWFRTNFEAAATVVSREFWDMFSNYNLSVIPMFILMGEFIFYAGFSDRLYRAANTWIGHRRGGLAHATMIASAAFSAICGSNTATAATMGAVAIPAMKKYGYHPALKSGAVAAGATLGVIVPPSVLLVVYGLYTGESIGKLFIGAIVPGMVLIALLLATVWFVCRRHPDWGPVSERWSWRDRIRALPDILDILVLFVLVMAALFSGYLTATETASAGAALSLLFCVIRRKLSWRGFLSAVRDTLRISCMIFILLAGAKIFGRFLTLTRLPFEISGWIGGLDLPPFVILWIMLICYMIGGCVMDALAFLLISLPIFLPLVRQLGYDPVWFGEVVAIVTTMGAITPPVGICCYVVAGMSKDISLGTVFRGSMYYLPAYVIAVLVLMLAPAWTVTFWSGLVR